MSERSQTTAPSHNILPLIRTVRNLRIILDVDLARLYGVPTRALNQAVKRNASRFPADFLFRLSPTESECLMRSQIVTASPGTGTATSAKRNIRHMPYAFTEHGALMAANLLNSPRAVAMSVYVIRAFVRMREDLAANSAILRRLAEIDKTLLVHDVTLREVLQKLRPLLEPPPRPPRPEIGFHVKEAHIPHRTAQKPSPARTRRPVPFHPSSFPGALRNSLRGPHFLETTLHQALAAQFTSS